MNTNEQLHYIEHKWLPWIYYGATKPFSKQLSID